MEESNSGVSVDGVQLNVISSPMCAGKENVGKKRVRTSFSPCSVQPLCRRCSLIENKDDDNVGTCSTLWRRIVLPLSSFMEIEPMPWICSFVSPSARRTNCERILFGHLRYVVKYSRCGVMCGKAPESTINLCNACEVMVNFDVIEKQ